MAKGTPVAITGTVDGINLPAEWKAGQHGNYKRCGFLLKDCSRAGVTWINYWWNEKDKRGDVVPNPFGMVKRGERYTFVCMMTEYNGKPQYDVQSYEKVYSLVGGDSPRHTEEEVEMDEPAPTKEVKVEMGKIIGVEEYNGNGYLVVLLDNGATVWARC